ncbi:hypothetical protein CerSpe_008380 [Prunus speciosa]
MEKSPAKGSDLKTLAIFPANEFFYNKILSRNSSVGSSSSRSYYFGRVTGSVPFQWEAKPGKPKLEAHDEEQQQHQNFDFVKNPPLIIGPPPATQSLNMNSLPYSSGPFSNSRVWLWKKLKKTHKLKRKLKKINKNNGEGNFDNAGLEQLYHQADLCKSDEEIMKFGSYGSSSSSCNSSSLSSTASASGSSSSSSTSDQNFRPSKIQRLARGFIRWAF